MECATLAPQQGPPLGLRWPTNEHLSLGAGHLIKHVLRQPQGFYSRTDMGSRWGILQKGRYCRGSRRPVESQLKAYTA